MAATDSPLRIVKLIYQSYLPHQGRYPRVSDQAGILQADGHDVTILACDRECRHPLQETTGGVKVERIRVRAGEHQGPFLQGLPILRFYLKALRWFQGRQVDVVVCHNLDVLPLGWLVRRRLGCKLVFDAHEPNYYALWPRYLRFMVALVEKVDLFFARRCDAVSVTNAYQVDKYRRVGVRRVEIIGNYTRPELCAATFDERKFAAQPIVFGRFGTIYPGTGVEYIVEAFASLLTRCPEARFLLGGRVADNYKQALEVQLARLGPAVTYLGAYEATRIVSLYSRIHVACLVYPKSAWFRNITPTKFYDAISNGVPVIMTDIGGLGCIIEQYECGLVVDERDTEGVARAMERLAQDRALLLKLARNAFELRNTLFSWPKLRETYTRLIRDVAAGR